MSKNVIETSDKEIKSSKIKTATGTLQNVFNLLEKPTTFPQNLLYISVVPMCLL